MAEYADALIAIWAGSKGTAHMIQIAERHGLAMYVGLKERSMSLLRVDCSKCSGTGLVKDPSGATLSELEQALHALDVTRDWIAGLIEDRRQDVRRWHLGRYSKAERNRTGKTAA